VADAANEGKTLQMVVQNDWTVDTISSLGSGYFSFLVYQEREIAPDVLRDFRDRLIGPDTVGEIVQARQNAGRRVALVAIKDINDFQGFFRLDFLILKVIPFLRGGLQVSLSDYQCFYRFNPE
jgi:hypothetical protein